MPPRAIYEHSGPAELMLEGENLTPDTLKLYHNGVLYTPLQSSDTYAYYLLGDNGTNKVMLNGKNFCTIIVRDIVVPKEMTGQLNIYQSNNSTTTGGDPINNVDVYSYCVNYPFKIDASHPYYRLHVYGTFENGDIDDISCMNCEINSSDVAQNDDIYLNVSVTDADKPAYITYQGFIIAVFNY